jgi:hypothetical protein
MKRWQGRHPCPDLRVQRNFLKRIKLILAVQSPPQKKFLFAPDPNHFRYLCRLVPPEGRLAIVTDAGRDAVDVDVLLTSGTEADGEDVWS